MDEVLGTDTSSLLAIAQVNRSIEYSGGTGQSPASTGLTSLPATDDQEKTRPDRGNRRTRRDSRTPDLSTKQETMMKKPEPRSGEEPVTPAKNLGWCTT